MIEWIIPGCTAGVAICSLGYAFHQGAKKERREMEDKLEKLRFDLKDGLHDRLSKEEFREFRRHVDDHIDQVLRSGVLTRRPR